MKRHIGLVFLTLNLCLLPFGALHGQDALIFDNDKIEPGTRVDWFALDTITLRTNYEIAGGEAYFTCGGEIYLDDGSLGTSGEAEFKIDPNLAYWDGGGSDDNWSTPENWGGDTVPESTDVVYFGSNSDNDVVVTEDIETAGIVVTESYPAESTIDFGDNTVTVSGGGDIIAHSENTVDLADAFVDFVGGGEYIVDGAVTTTPGGTTSGTTTTGAKVNPGGGGSCFITTAKVHTPSH